MKLLIVSLLFVISCVANGGDNWSNGNNGNIDNNNNNNWNNGNNGNQGNWDNGNNGNSGNSGYDDGNSGNSGNSGYDNGNTGSNSGYDNGNTGHNSGYNNGNTGNNNGTDCNNGTNWNNGNNTSNNNTQQDCTTCQEMTQIEQYLSDSSVYVAEVKILSKVDNSNGKYKDNLVRYRAKVLTVYNGCLKIAKCPIVLETSLDVSGCGRPLDDCLGQQFVISFRAGSTSCKNSYAFGLCDFYVSSDLLTDDDWFLLNNWRNDCLGVCSTGNEVQCLVAPCQTATPPDGCDVYGAICTDNYCNGCNAFWWNDDGTLRCHSNGNSTLSGV